MDKKELILLRALHKYLFENEVNFNAKIEAYNLYNTLADKADNLNLLW